MKVGIFGIEQNKHRKYPVGADGVPILLLEQHRGGEQGTVPLCQLSFRGPTGKRWDSWARLEDER